MLRRFFRYFLPLVIVVAAVVWTVYRADSEARLAELERAEEKYVALAAESLAHDFRAVIADLLLLADASSLRRALETAPPGDVADAAGEFQNVAQRKQVYDQIRFLDLEGDEIIRVNFDGRQASIVPAEDLQSKVDRYYFHETMKLNPGTVFVSPFDLNVEDGRIEEPYKPTVRFATPVMGPDRRRRGILVLNYLGTSMLRRFARLDVDSIGQAMLVNARGYWLYAGDKSVEWAFMFPERRDVRFADRHPAAWQAALDGDSGQVRSDDGLFTFETVKPLGHATADGQSSRLVSLAPASPGYTWHVISRVSPYLLSAQLLGVRSKALALSGLLLLASGGGSWALARYSLARERSERALRESEARFRQMADSIAEVFWLSTPDRRTLRYISPAFADIWGRPAESLNAAAALWEESILASDRAAYETALRSVGTVDEFSSEYRIRRSDGEVRWIWDHGFAVRDAGGRISGYAGIAEDVTPLKEAQDKALQSERLAAIGEAMAGLAHESRNALQRSQACLEMLQSRVATQPEAVKLLARIRAAVEDLHRLHERVRCYAAPIQLRREDCDLQLVWDRACRDALACAGERPVRIQPQPAAGPPPCTRCYADPHAVGQVFRNVLENALDPELETSPARDAVEVNVGWNATTLRHKPALVITISDNGPGLDPAARARIFEPFFTTKARGTGLGMAISRRIVEAHGGSISASNGHARGLTVEIVLPKESV